MLLFSGSNICLPRHDFARLEAPKSIPADDASTVELISKTYAMHLFFRYLSPPQNHGVLGLGCFKTHLNGIVSEKCQG